MPFELASFAEKLRGIQSADTHWDVCHKEFEAFGVTSLCYGFVPFASEAREYGFTAAGFYKSSHTKEWLDVFGADTAFDNEYSVEALITENKPLFWHDEAEWEDATKEQKQQFDVERDMGMHVGISFPIADTSLDCAVSGIGLNIPDVPENEFNRYWETNMSQLNQIACLLEEGIRQRHGNALVSLSGRERDCLSYLAIGLRADEIAFRLRISPKTLETYILNAKKKLRARTRDHAVAKALMLGAIQP